MAIDLSALGNDDGHMQVWRVPHAPSHNFKRAIGALPFHNIKVCAKGLEPTVGIANRQDFRIGLK